MKIGLLLASLAIAALPTGCGGGETAAAPLPKAEFIKRADAICSAGKDRFQTLFENYVHKNDIGFERTRAQWAGIVENALAPAIEEELEGIRTLGMPRGDSRQINAMLRAVEEGLQEVREYPSAAGDTEAQFAKSRRLALAYGFSICGS